MGTRDPNSGPQTRKPSTLPTVPVSPASRGLYHMTQDSIPRCACQTPPHPAPPPSHYHLLRSQRGPCEYSTHADTQQKRAEGPAATCKWPVSTSRARQLSAPHHVSQLGGTSPPPDPSAWHGPWVTDTTHPACANNAASTLGEMEPSHGPPPWVGGPPTFHESPKAPPHYPLSS